MPSRLPWITSTGQRMPRNSACTEAVFGSPASAPSTVRINVSGVVSRPHATVSSRCLVECGSGKTSPKKNSRKPR
jgi:hypothetical protein